MKNILVLYNPYYQEDVIEQHLEILKERGSVAFGKIRSKLRNYESPNEDELNIIYENVSREIPLQLFLTDYNNIYVANVVAVKTEKAKLIKAPMYYDKLDVEKWFIFDDLRLLVHENFAIVRDKILANFKATNYNNRTYAVYGNQYVYPMQVTMKEDINYFIKDDQDYKYFTDIFKTKEQIEIKENLIEFKFGEKVFYALAVNSQDNIISAEIEYIANKKNLLYDFSAVILKYSKACELELFNFFKTFFSVLIRKNNSIKNFPYSIQGRDYRLEDILKQKPNYGTYKYLLKSYDIKSSINSYIENRILKSLIFTDLIFYINTIQEIRNESVHGEMATLKQCKNMRKHILGIGGSGIFCNLIKYKKYIEKESSYKL